MKIALIGYGAMGRLIDEIAVERRHKVVAIIDEADYESNAAEVAAKLAGAKVAIDFSTASAVRRNVEACIEANVALVEGTTGWNEQLDEISRLVTTSDAAMVYGANFSIGVNLFYRISEYAAGLIAKFPEYEAFIEEQHHSRKKDAPSGTALKLKEVVSKHIDIGDIAATRAGNIPGTHRIGFDGSADQIVLEHAARSRNGFAHGAVLAAEWIEGKKGFYEFADVIDLVVSGLTEIQPQMNTDKHG